MSRKPIRHYIALESKFFLQQAVECLGVLASVAKVVISRKTLLSVLGYSPSVDTIVGTHHRCRSSSDCVCKRPEIGLVHSLFGLAGFEISVDDANLVIDIRADSFDGGTVFAH